MSVVPSGSIRSSCRATIAPLGKKPITLLSDEEAIQVAVCHVQCVAAKEQVPPARARDEVPVQAAGPAAPYAP